MGRNIVDWLDVAPLSGYADRILSVTASTLEELDQRAATIKAYNTTYGITATTLFKQVKVSSVVCHSCEMLHDVPASGGTVTSADCGNYRIEVFYVDGTSEFISEDSATITGSLVVSSSTIESRHNVGDLPLTITYGGKSTTYNVPVYQAAAPYLTLTPGSITFGPDGGVAYINVSSSVDWDINVTGDTGATITGITLSGLTWVTDVPASGGTADSGNCSYYIMANWSDSSITDVTSSATVTGNLSVSSTTATTRENVGTLTLTASYSGFTDIDSVSVYQESALYQNDYLTFTVISGGNITWVMGGNSATAKTIEYKINDGNWISITSDIVGSAPVITVSEGDVVKLKGNNNVYSDGGAVTSSFFSGGSHGAKYDVSGNILSLVYGDNFTGYTSLPTGYSYTFSYLFYRSNCVSAENLILPTGLENYCFSNMFTKSYYLTTSPNLPTTAITQGCYYWMFLDCTGLTNVQSILPAETLTTSCYGGMFSGCTSLTTAPELPATTLAGFCYYQMFKGCTRLNYIKCLATDISASNCTYNWVNGVSASGEFVKDANMGDWPTGNSGIPGGWTITDN